MHLEATGFDSFACPDELLRKENGVTDPDGIAGERFFRVAFKWFKIVEVFDIDPLPVEQQNAFAQIGACSLEMQCFAVSNHNHVVAQRLEM